MRQDIGHLEGLKTTNFQIFKKIKKIEKNS